ncbi:hypothetical protein DRW07_14470 [Alteromonas sediminis]|uniref:Prephenate dehydrogenase n=1 Tax=Alteromonas sediminis TaxID=2259342 RepID=A0A3N5XY10_9ALTE|nr:hypothetical protein [Alteromonas sediminis]RPJ66007.1 hypothetical protein DRW07_14470 [Alteromonas sediminis]
MHAIQEQIKATLQDIYRKAVDADAKLDALQSQQQGKFKAIFEQQAGFTTSAKRFLPYVEELTNDFEALSTSDEQAFKADLSKLVNKMEVMLRTLTTFKSV